MMIVLVHNPATGQTQLIPEGCDQQQAVALMEQVVRQARLQASPTDPAATAASTEYQGNNHSARAGDAMRIIVDGVKQLTENKQQELGQSILVGMFHAGIPVDGVSVEFEEQQ